MTSFCVCVFLGGGGGGGGGGGIIILELDSESFAELQIRGS